MLIELSLMFWFRGCFLYLWWWFLCTCV